MGDALAGRVALVTGASPESARRSRAGSAAEGAAVAIVAAASNRARVVIFAGSLRETADAIAAAGGAALPIVADLSDPACDRAAIVAQRRGRARPGRRARQQRGRVLLPESRRDIGAAAAGRVRGERHHAVPARRRRSCPRCASGAGWIVNITSAIVDTNQLDSPQQARSSTYAPSKAALDRLTVSFATELRGTGIAVNALAPERAVATEGATAVMDLPPEWCEPVEVMAEAALALATCDPERENGLVVRSGPLSPGTGTRAVTVALVTGGGSGIGQATARAARGARCTGGGGRRRTSRPRAATRQPRSAIARPRFASTWPTPPTVAAMVALTVEQFGGLDWACNIAGIAPEPKPFIEHTHRRLAAHHRRQPERRVLLHATRAAADGGAGYAAARS